MECTLGYERAWVDVGKGWEAIVSPAKLEFLMKIIQNHVPLILIITTLIFCGATNAKPRIVILDFELNDITSLPNTPKELVRTASVKPLIERVMIQQENYDIIQISPEAQKQANPGVGYLFRYHDVAAKLGDQFKTDWILVGQHSKPSFLYSYLMAYLINIKTEIAVARFDIELKGNHQKVTERGVKKLVQEINATILKP
jgi:hypothetical protein